MKRYPGYFCKLAVISFVITLLLTPIILGIALAIRTGEAYMLLIMGFDILFTPLCISALKELN